MAGDTSTEEVRDAAPGDGSAGLSSESEMTKGPRSGLTFPTTPPTPPPLETRANLARKLRKKEVGRFFTALTVFSN